MTSFKLAKNIINGRPMVEVWDGGKLIAGIYATDACTFRVVSKHPIASELDANAPNTLNVKVGQ